MEYLNVLKRNTKWGWAQYKADPAVVAMAGTASKNVNSDGRTPAQVYADCLNGFALEQWFFDIMSNHNVDIKRSNNYLWDFEIEENGKTYLIDIKGIFRDNSKYWVQSSYETRNVHTVKGNIFYLCFNCKTHSVYYKGYTTQQYFTKSQFNSSRYISEGKLFK